MNGKPDEPLDQWVRQSLDRLPDAPPPGTTFDAGRLWNQISPELPRTPARWRFGWGWWTAAACVAGLLLLGWLSIDQQPAFSHRIGSRTERLDTPTAVNRKPETIVRIDRSEPAYPAKTRPSSPSRTRHSERMAKTVPLVLPEIRPAQPVADATEPLRIMDTVSSGSTRSEPIKITVAAAPKRRFRVVHLNELQAEEAIRPTPHRTDRFVRLGTGDHGQPVPETAHPTITWPLTNRLNQ